jgi:predicted enzyme related to lactoylglutathione lyase
MGRRIGFVFVILEKASVPSEGGQAGVMSPEPHHRAGDFSWTGLLTGDVERALSFYGAVFGWTAETGRTENGRVYSTMRMGDERVALVYEIADWQRAFGAPTNWATFVAVSNVDESVRSAVRLGGRVAIPPYDIEGAARIAVITDPGGARLSLWQPLGGPVPRRDDAVGTCWWNELATDSVDAVASFHARLFGWELQRRPSGYRIISNGGRPQGGICTLGGHEQERPHWLPYFRVAALRDAVERCARAGGQIADPTSHDSVAILRDPEGARFGVCTRLPSASGGDVASQAAGGRGVAA